MYRTIVVPLDGSDLAERALPYAEMLARAAGGRLILVRAAASSRSPSAALQDLSASVGRVVGPVLAPQAVDERRSEPQAREVEAAEAHLRQHAARLGQQGIAAETAVPVGDAAEGILDQVRTSQADLVVMGTHGRSGLGRWVCGSVAEAVLGRSPVPVLLVRGWHEREPRPFEQRPCILVALDGSEFAATALPAAADLAQALGGELVLVQAVPELNPQLGDVPTPVREHQDALVADADDYLEGIQKRLGQEYPGLRVRREARLSDPAEGIVAAADGYRADLVVMSTHGRSGLLRTVLGSVAGTVLHRGQTPLLLVRPGSSAHAAAVSIVPPASAPAGSQTSLAVDAEDVALIRTALEALRQEVTRHEHLQAPIRHLLDRLPAGPPGTP